MKKKQILLFNDSNILTNHNNKFFKIDFFNNICFHFYFFNDFILNRTKFFVDYNKYDDYSDFLDLFNIDDSEGRFNLFYSSRPVYNFSDLFNNRGLIFESGPVPGVIKFFY